MELRWKMGLIMLGKQVCMIAQLDYSELTMQRETCLFIMQGGVGWIGYAGECW